MFLKIFFSLIRTDQPAAAGCDGKNTCKQTKNIEMGEKEAEFLWLILENFKDIVTASVFVVKCQACESIR